MPEPSSRDIPAPIHRPIGRIAAGAPRRAGDRLSNARVLRENASRRRATSLFAARKRGMIDSALMVQGNDVPASDGATFERLNPMTGDVATRAAAATPGDAASAVAAAAAAFPAWSALGPGERRVRLLRAADCLERRASDFVDAMAQETGATAGWAQFNVYLGAGMLREAAAMTTQIAGEIIPSDRLGMTAMALRQPVGVVLGMAPWNAPVILGVRAIAMPLACGNTVVLKSSEICPRTHRLIGEALREADLGEGVVNVVSNAPADASRIVEALVANPAVRRVNFTGSTRVGRVVAEVCARHLKPVLLELGGKAPFVILDDADLDEAVKAAAFGAFMNQGQICMSTERIVVDEAVADSFAAKFAKKAATLVAGDPRKGNTPLGSLVSYEAVERINRLIKDAISKGAQILAGGHANGTLMDATVLDHVTLAMRIYSEESFGPVAAIVRVQGVEEAIRVANDTEYGLSSAVFGGNVQRALEVASRIEAGICHINSATVNDEPQMPFGGVKSSGYGRFGGKAAIHEFTELRWLTIASLPGHYPI
jgi:acyl-CoA reductase-like NAD-dependent aldehyde dehydrogenase